jgi:hypothetical protein
MKRKAVTFYYDDDTGECTRATVSRELRGECLLMQVDVLQDVAGMAETLLQDTYPLYEKHYEELAAKAKQKKTPSQ